MTFSQYDIFTAETAINNSAKNYGMFIAGLRDNQYSSRNVAQLVRDAIVATPCEDRRELWNVLIIKAERVLALWNAACPEIA